MKRSTKWLAAVAMVSAASVAQAHHGWSAYDSDTALKIEAPLQEVRYRNPHAEVQIDHDGRRWTVILAPTRRMESRGLPANALQKGETILIEGYPKRDGSPEMRAERITVDGKVIELR